jgi:hypothetical protein
MSYKFETQWDSPNFSRGNNGRKFIVIHWWDAPENNPSYEGVISTLCNPSRYASAHFVATGTGRRVACLVNMDDTAWHAGTSNPATNPNPISLGIECDPRCRDEDYDVVAELICNIRSAFGDLPLKRHSDFVATRCPGNWDLNRLDALARKKKDGGDWGLASNIGPTAAEIAAQKAAEAAKIKAEAERLAAQKAAEAAAKLKAEQDAAKAEKARLEALAKAEAEKAEAEKTIQLEKELEAMRAEQAVLDAKVEADKNANKDRNKFVDWLIKLFEIIAKFFTGWKK